MSVRLKIEHGQDEGKTWSLKQPGVYVLGRDPTNSIRVIDMKVSKGHCEIEVSGGTNGVWLRDLKSTHGTQLNGQPVSRETSLKPGDEIRVGFTVLRLLSDGPSDAAAVPNRARQAPAPAGPSPAAAGLAATYVGPAPAAAAGAGGAPASPASAGGAKPLAAGAAAPKPGPNGAGAGAPPPPKELPPDELVGKDLAGYRVLKKIGQGGMGAVYIAEQVSLKREVALKVLSEKFVADSAFVDQFVNEARAAGQLNHPNVVQVYDVGQVDGRYFFSMEFVAGGSIEDKVHGKAAEWRAALNWFLDAANALIFAGKRGILHRDVKPDNLMLAEDGSAKLCDLGLAKKSESSDLLAQGIIGTPHFISPEAIRRKPDIDTRTDLYSLGCTFFRILTGQNPYPAATVKDILLGHLNKPVPRVTEKKADVPKELSDVVYKLMQKEPAERYASAGELHTALDRIRVQHGLAEHGIKPHSRKPLVIALALVLVAAGVVGYVLTRPEPPREKTQKEKDDEQRLKDEAAEEARKRAAAERGGFVAKARERFADLKAKAAAGRIEDTWAEAKWDELLKEFEDLAAELEGDKKFGKEADIELLVAEIRQYAIDAIVTPRTGLKVVDARYQQARQKAQKDFTEELQERRRRYDAALEPEAEGAPARWWEAARLVAKEPMKQLVEKWANPRFLEGKIDLPLLRDEDRKKLFASLFPGEDWPGQKLHDDAVKLRAPMVHLNQMSDRAKPAEAGTIEGVEQAAAAMDAYKELLPEPDPTDVGEVAELLRAHRRDAGKKASELRAKNAAAVESQFAQDRREFFDLVHMLREPGRGALWTLMFSVIDGDPKRLADGMRRPEYRALALQQIDDARAVAGLFNNLVSAFAAKQWVEGDFEGPDGKKVKVLEVGPDGMVCPGKVKVTFADLGPKALLARLFFVGEQPRFAFATEDLRGLAVLAEMAGESGKAQAQWMAYKAKLGAQDPAAEQAVMKRLGGLDREMEAARLWLEAKAHHDAIRQMERDLAELGLLSPPKPPLSAAQREKIQRARDELEQHLTEAGQGLATLGMREDLASTIWGASVLPTPNPKAAYAGETLATGGSPPPVPAPAPAPAPVKPN